MEVEVTTTYLEMTSPEQLCPPKTKEKTVEVKKLEIPNPVINRDFFVNVGRIWQWYSRLEWTWQDWENWVEKEGVETWLGYWKNTPIGYAEWKYEKDWIELVFFGLLPQFMGKGLARQV